MKILHIIDSAGLYGAEMVLLNLAQEQAKQGHNPVIASIREKDEFEMPLEEEAARRGLETETFRMLDGPNLIGALNILRYAWSNKFDVMHSHGYKGNILLGSFPRGIRKIPVISTVHGWTSTEKWSRMRLYEWADTFSFRYLDAVVLVSGSMKKHPLLSARRLSRLHVVNNGIPSCVPENGQRISDSIDKKIEEFCSGPKTIGAIGRLSSEKGFVFLLEAFRDVIAKGHDARLVIIGDGPERQKLEKTIAGWRMNDRVLLPGYVGNASRYLRLFQIFVIPSLTEGLPISLLEAMRARVPVVSTRVGGIEDVLAGGDAGVIVDPGSSDKLLRGICTLINNGRLADDMAKMAREIFLNNYSSEIMSREYLKVYHSVM